MNNSLRNLALSSVCVLLAACGGGGGGLSNKDPGNNDVGVVAAFGDSITQGNQCSCPPYPARLGPMIGKSVPNFGIGGSTAEDNVGRTQSVIDQSRPGFMLILYGVNDVIHAHGIGTIIGTTSTFSPSHYGEILPDRLPNTGVLGTISCKLFARPDAATVDDTCMEPDCVIDLDDKELAWQFIIDNYGNH